MSSNLQTLHGPGDVELVHGVDDDGWRGEEEEQQEEEDVEEDAAEPPARAAHRQVLPVAQEGESFTGNTGETQRAALPLLCIVLLPLNTPPPTPSTMTDRPIKERQTPATAAANYLKSFSLCKRRAFKKNAAPVKSAGPDA